jgi:3-deoxy-D-manno-octulosonic-acid transferase
VNGWLYMLQPSSRVDWIERALLTRPWLSLIDLTLAQTEDARARLISLGAAPDKIKVTGNTKFDAAAEVGSALRGRSPLLLESIRRSGRTCIVAGSVTNIDDQELIIDAFARFLKVHPRALLILAPRHPEVGERMQKLEELLSAKDLRFAFRTRILDGPVPDDLQCIALDSMGELYDYYAVASVAYVGRNKNVLEPVGFRKPVCVSPGWKKTQPNFPIYRLLVDSGAVEELDEAEALCTWWHEMSSNPEARGMRIALMENVVQRHRGATIRDLQFLKEAGLLEWRHCSEADAPSSARAVRGR